MRAIMVAVDYSDMLAITLPWNQHHFENICIVTDNNSFQSVRDVIRPYRHKVGVHITDAFYRDGASFNKWRALEQGLDFMGREGWTCLMDADVLWPKEMEWGNYPGGNCLSVVYQGRQSAWSPGHLITPMRRMMYDFPDGTFSHDPLHPGMCRQEYLYPFPPEDYWKDYPLHRNINEWAGYTQIFHASDPVLGDPPWHETDWVHAGGADSLFQGKWPVARKIRPAFEVLHLGPSGLNWYGRSTKYVDGSINPQSQDRQARCMKIWDERRKRKREGLDPFSGEKIETPGGGYPPT